MVGGADEHRLLAQRDALLAMGEDPVADRGDLGVLVARTHELRARCAGAGRATAAGP